MRYLLSIDGGGVRGVLPCSTLIALEQQTGRLTRDLFHFVAGTSTGALLASAVAAGIPATQILKIYTDRSKEIFTPGEPWATARRLATGAMYNPANIRKVLASEFGPAANWALDESPIRLLLTAKGIDRHPWYFVQDRPRNAHTTGGLSLVDCATASAAAPTYFGPWYVPPARGCPVGWCFDGGVGVTGNPVYQACVEAFEYDDFTPADTRVISLGTGFYPTANPNPPSGFLATLEWTVDTLVSAPEDQQTEIVSRHYPGILRRFDWALPRAIDMADIASIPDLVRLGSAAAAGMDWGKALS